MCIFYKLRYGQQIDFFCDHFKLDKDVRRYNTKSSDDYYLSYQPKGNYGYATFHFKTIVLWNALPLHIKESRNFDVFKRELKLHLLNKQLTMTV